VSQGSSAARGKEYTVLVGAVIDNERFALTVGMELTRLGRIDEVLFERSARLERAAGDSHEFNRYVAPERSVTRAT
jgi:hypothetical protein